MTTISIALVIGFFIGFCVGIFSDYLLDLMEEYDEWRRGR